MAWSGPWHYHIPEIDVPGWYYSPAIDLDIYIEDIEFYSDIHQSGHQSPCPVAAGLDFWADIHIKYKITAGEPFKFYIQLHGSDWLNEKLVILDTAPNWTEKYIETPHMLFPFGYNINQLIGVEYGIYHGATWINHGDKSNRYKVLAGANVSDIRINNPVLFQEV